MKIRIFNLITLITVMFTISSCNNDDFPSIEEGKADNGIITKLIDWDYPIENQESLRFNWNSDETFQHSISSYKSLKYIFHTQKEFDESELKLTYVANLFPTVDWSKQTLLIAAVYTPHIIADAKCQVYVKSGKYTIDLNLLPTFLDAFDTTIIAIVLNEKGIEEKDVKFVLRNDGWKQTM